MTNTRGGKRKGAGAKTYKELGIRKKVRKSIAFPPYLWDELMNDFPGGFLSEYISELVEIGFQTIVAKFRFNYHYFYPS